MAKSTHALLVAIVVLVTSGCQATGDSAQPAAPAAAAAAPARADAASTGDAPTDGITVVGHGRVTGQPDTLRATVGVEVVRPDVAAAFDAASAAADRVIAALQEQGVGEDDISTREFSVHPQQEHRPDQPPATTGYVVRNLVEAIIRNTDQAGAVLAAVTDAAGDAARIEGLRFSLEDNDAHLRAAREDAFADARAKAEHYATLAGVALGELRSLTEVSAQLPPPVPVAEQAVGSQRAAPPPIRPGEQEVAVQVQATWALG